MGAAARKIDSEISGKESLVQGFNKPGGQVEGQGEILH